MAFHTHPVSTHRVKRQHIFRKLRSKLQTFLKVGADGFGEVYRANKTEPGPFGDSIVDFALTSGGEEIFKLCPKTVGNFHVMTEKNFIL